MPSTARPRVLIVDPSDENRAVLSELLRRAGAEPESAAAEDALDAIRRLLPAAVVVDADAIAGGELAELAKSAARTASAIVVAGTNRPRSAALEGVTFVRKPYHYAELVHKIWTTLGGRTAPGQAAA